MSAVGIVFGVILILYFIGGTAFGIVLQCKSMKLSKEAYGKIAYPEIILHFITGFCFIGACFDPNFMGWMIAGFVFYFMKLLWEFIGSSEARAFYHMKGNDDMLKFL